MLTKDEIVKAAEFVADHLGNLMYVVDFMDCDECPDADNESCPVKRPGFNNMEKMAACRSKRVMVRPVSMDFADIRLNAGDDGMTIVINDCYECEPGEIFTTREAATKHMESLPDDVLKYYPSA